MLSTAGVIFPFAISAILILSKYIDKKIGPLERRIVRVKKHSYWTKNSALWEFVYLIIVILVLFTLNLWPIIVPIPSSVTEVCEKNPLDFGMEPDSCARIKPGCIYEECVKNTIPDVNQCSIFMID